MRFGGRRQRGTEWWRPVEVTAALTCPSPPPSCWPPPGPAATRWAPSGPAGRAQRPGRARSGGARRSGRTAWRCRSRGSWRPGRAGGAEGCAARCQRAWRRTRGAGGATAAGLEVATGGWRAVGSAGVAVVLPAASPPLSVPPVVGTWLPGPSSCPHPSSSQDSFPAASFSRPLSSSLHLFSELPPSFCPLQFFAIFPPLS